MSLLSVESLTVRYGAKLAVENVNFSLESGDWLMLVGPNGAGKSTTAEAIAGGLSYTGSVRFEGHEISALKPHLRAQCIGVLTQAHEALSDFTVAEVVYLGRYCRRRDRLRGRDALDEIAVATALRDTGLTDMQDKRITALSGGEKQRVFLAQVFAQQPNLLILDEPANHLDLVYREQTFELIQNWLAAERRACICVVHDLSVAKLYGTKALLLDRGRQIAFGALPDALSNARLAAVYQTDVSAWMRRQLSLWAD